MNRASLSYDPVIRDFHYPERRGLQWPVKETLFSNLIYILWYSVRS